MPARDARMEEYTPLPIWAHPRSCGGRMLWGAMGDFRPVAPSVIRLEGTFSCYVLVRRWNMALEETTARDIA